MSEEHRTFDLRRAFCIGSSHAQAPLGSSHAPHARTDGVASCASAVFFSKTRPGALFSRAKPSRVYYDTARSGGVGGKANTCPRNQTGHWRGYNLLAGKKGSKRGLRPGEEIFVPYGREYNLHVGGNGIDDARQGWGFTRRRRQSGGGRREEEQTAVLEYTKLTRPLLFEMPPVPRDVARSIDCRPTFDLDGIKNSKKNLNSSPRVSRRITQSPTSHLQTFCAPCGRAAMASRRCRCQCDYP